MNVGPTGKIRYRAFKPRGHKTALLVLQIEVVEQANDGMTFVNFWRDATVGDLTEESGQ